MPNLLRRSKKILVPAPHVDVAIRERQCIRQFERRRRPLVIPAVVAARQAHQQPGDGLEVVHFTEHAVHDHGAKIRPVDALTARDAKTVRR